jgi:hypothetical protein
LRSRNFSLELLNKVAASGDIEYFDHLVSRGANPHKSLALHSACKCKDPEQTTAMIKHLLDVHHMNIEADIEDFRDYFHASADTGTPLNAAVHRQNMPSLLALLKRGADPNKAIWQSISRVIVTPWLPAVGPLLDAGADPTDAFEDAVDHTNFAAAQVCLEKGANPTGALRAQQAKTAEKASGAWDRASYECVEGDGGDSDGDDEDVAVNREGMRKSVREAGNAWLGAQSELMGFPSD